MKIGILDMYMYLPMLALIVGIGFVFFAEDRFRYECQNPIYWGTPQCEPPLCKAAGVCTEDLIKFETSTIEETVVEEVLNGNDIEAHINCNCTEEETNVE